MSRNRNMTPEEMKKVADKAIIALDDLVEKTRELQNVAQGFSEEAQVLDEELDEFAKDVGNLLMAINKHFKEEQK